MNSVRLDDVRNIDQALVDHGNKGRVVFGSKNAKDLIERLNVIAAVVGRQGDAGKKNFNVGVFERCYHYVEIAASLVWWYTAETIVAAKFNNGDGGVELKDGAEIGNRIFGGGPTRAQIRYFVEVTALIQIPLQGVGIRLAGSQSVACRDAVAVA